MNTAIITGASSGMGREFVKMTAARGDVDEIWVIARREDKLKELQKEVKVPLHILPLDLLKAESYERFQAELDSRKPNVTFLVNARAFALLSHAGNVNVAPYSHVNDTAVVPVAVVPLTVRLPEPLFLETVMVVMTRL